MSLNNQTTVTSQTTVSETTVPLTNVRDALHAKEAELNNDAAFRIAEIEKSAQRVIDNIESQKQEILRDIQFKRQQAELQLQQADMLRREADERQRRAAELVGAAPERLGVSVKAASYDETHVSESGLQYAAAQQSSLHQGPSAASTLNRAPLTTSTTTVSQQQQQPIFNNNSNQQQQLHNTNQPQYNNTNQTPIAQPLYNNVNQTPIAQQQPAAMTTMSNAPLASAATLGDGQLHNLQYNNNTWNTPTVNNMKTTSTSSPRNTTAQNLKQDIKQDAHNVKQDAKYEEQRVLSPNSQSSSSTGGFFSSLKNVFMPTPPVPNDVAQYQNVTQDQMLAQKTNNMSLKNNTNIAPTVDRNVVADTQSKHISSA